MRDVYYQSVGNPVQTDRLPMTRPATEFAPGASSPDVWRNLLHVSAIAVITFAVFWIEGVHFYVNHRLLHLDPLYKWAHALHHKNVNTGPWSGISMHPLEHVLYFSLPLVFLVIPASPFVIAFCGIYLMLSPSPSHSGFDRFVLPGGRTMYGGDYFHNLHHRYFECNYGMLLVPIDKWMGTFHDGTPPAHQKMRQRRAAARRS